MKITKATKWALWGIGILILFVTIMTIVSLSLKEEFGVKNADIDRKIYEQSKSYIHGKLQDLAKYYEEYQKTDASGKEVIRNLIQMNFASFDCANIDNQKLKIFLIEMRGFK
jgi:hypothetical protein